MSKLQPRKLSLPHNQSTTTSAWYEYARLRTVSVSKSRSLVQQRFFSNVKRVTSKVRTTIKAAAEQTIAEEKKATWKQSVWQ
mmetsp:Transcript_10097/g.19201  ORF Transcript_10097/g.19201 Transcript_10097/m.19201 type:complete len:82 (-) Transcript_10097:545-790(-)